MLKAIHIWRRLPWLAAYPACAAALAYASGHPALVESAYSLGAYQKIRHWLTATLGGVPFSVAEIVVMAVALLSVARIVAAVARTVRMQGRGLVNLLSCVVDIAAMGGAACMLFVALWGLNNCRLPLSVAAGIDASPASASELEEASRILLDRAAVLRAGANEGDGGEFRLDEGKTEALATADSGFFRLRERFPSLGLSSEDARGVGAPKPVALSVLLSYCGVSGIYFPITGEANVNMDLADPEAPFVMCHELAHKIGYAREDEANFIAWLACDASADAGFRYSGNLLAFVNVMNALYRAAPERHAAILDSCPEGVARDLDAIGRFWKRHEGAAQDASTVINDTFLKATGQDQGIKSYGMMADLAVGYILRERTGAG